MFDVIVLVSDLVVIRCVMCREMLFVVLLVVSVVVWGNTVVHMHASHVLHIGLDTLAPWQETLYH